MWKLRLQTIQVLGLEFRGSGSQILGKATEVTPLEQSQFAFGLLLSMGGDLLLSTARLCSAGHFYSAASLIRQIVEIEYLTWAFKEKHLLPQAWLNSSHKERQNIFSPRELRKTSKGRFLDKDYREHCETGGHPVPKGMHLFRPEALASFQILAVDVITHGWRTWDQTRLWVADFPAASKIVDESSHVLLPALTSWGTRDKIYQLMCEHKPT